MYEELIKALRDRADTLYNASRLYDSDAEDAAILYKAADAIDDLSREIDIDNAAITAMDAAMPRWIPVTERLPEKTGTYLAWMKWDPTEADEEPSAYPVLYDADAEGFGWWKSYYDGETLGWAGEDFVRYEGITHWMPLPEPPKEE